jgi:hypothetical protein
MVRQKGIAFCGLACALCSENSACAGCRNEGCEDKESCKNFQCCKTKNINGCWECDEFPCTGNMLDNRRIRAFARFAGEYGVEFLLDCLEKNEKAGIVYHYPGQLDGDYDVPETEESIFELLLNGKQAK